MKKHKIQIDKLTIDKETVSRLDEEQLGNFLGGGGPPDSVSCGGTPTMVAMEEDLELAWKSCCGYSCN
jgi:hypothetical protein